MLTSGQVEVSVVIPCLNEAETVGDCIRSALRAIQTAGLDGEVVVADNGSDDGSRAVAEAAGARVAPVAQRGYGSALMGGIAAARGRYVFMADADGSYDFQEIGRFVAALASGNDIVIGCRLPSGKGAVQRTAMPVLHRWLGNPLLSILARHWFRAPVHDIYCGMRAFTMAHYRELDQRCHGMEFAVEMIVRSTFSADGSWSFPSPFIPIVAFEETASPDVPGWLADTSLLPASQSPLALPHARLAADRSWSDRVHGCDVRHDGRGCSPGRS